MPLIFKVPGITKRKINRNITELIDIYPTLCSLSGLELPGQLTGASLIGRLKNPGRMEDYFAVCKWANRLTWIEGNFYIKGMILNME